MSSFDPTLLPAWLPVSAVNALEEAEAKIVAALPLAELSERLEWRVCRLYRDICFLFGLRDSQQKGYVFAESHWFTEKYKCDAATLRRWQAVLVKHGWLASIGKGPQRRLIPLVHPGKVVVFFARFARLFSGVLRGFWGRPPISPEKERNSNRSVAPKSQDACSGKETAVVALLRQNGIGTEKQAVSLVREFGVERCLEQLDALPYRKALNPGAILSSSIREDYPAPPGLIAARESQKRQEEERVKAEELRRRREAERQRRSEEARVRAEALAARREAEQAERMAEAPAELLPLWHRALECLKETVNGPSFGTHIASLVPVGRVGDRITLRAVSAFARDWVLRRHGAALTSALCMASGGAVEVELTNETG